MPPTHHDRFQLNSLQSYYTVLLPCLLLLTTPRCNQLGSQVFNHSLLQLYDSETAMLPNVSANLLTLCCNKSQKLNDSFVVVFLCNYYASTLHNVSANLLTQQPVATIWEVSQRRRCNSSSQQTSSQFSQ